MKVLDVEIGIVHPAPFNPPMRTSSRALRGLLDDIRKHGITAPIPAIERADGHYVIADGHRRYSCAVILGMKHVPIRVSDSGISALAEEWARLNKETLKMSALSWMEAYVSSGETMADYVPTAILGSIRECKIIFGGLDGLRYLIDRRTAPSICRTIRSVHTILSDLPKCPSKREIGRWMVESHSYGTMNQIVSGRVPMNKRAIVRLMARINSGTQFVLSDVIRNPPRANGSSE